MWKKIFEYLVFYLVNLITKHNIFLFPSLFSFYKIYDSMIIRTWCCGSVDSYSLNTNFRGWVLDFFNEMNYLSKFNILLINVLMVSMITNSHILDSHIYTELMPSSANETTICSVVLFAIISTFQNIDT